jgi:hypothetical protein
LVLLLKRERTELELKSAEVRLVSPQRTEVARVICCLGPQTFQDGSPDRPPWERPNDRKAEIVGSQLAANGVVVLAGTCEKPPPLVRFERAGKEMQSPAVIVVIPETARVEVGEVLDVIAVDVVVFFNDRFAIELSELRP